MRTLVLGMGNTILSDDGAGIYVARERARASREGVHYAEASVGGLRLLDIIAGYERVILVDAIQTASGTPGDIYRLQPDDLMVSRHAGSSHDLSLPGALALGRGMGMSLPKDQDLCIIALEVADVTTFGEECTPAVAAAIPQAVQAVQQELARSAAPD
jgi:hydrogenase maturation protease